MPESSADRRLEIGLLGNRIAVDAEDLSRCFSLEEQSLIDGIMQCDRLFRAGLYTKAAEPAFIRINDDRGFALDRIWKDRLHPAFLRTLITADTFPGVDRNRLARCDRVWDQICFIFKISHIIPSPQLSLSVE